MKIDFAPRVSGDSALTVIPVEKDGVGRIVAGALGDAGGLAAAAARASRFEGEAGGLVELFVPAAGGARRIVLLGVGSGSDADWERAGGALTARYLVSGATAATVDFAAMPAAPGASAVARFALAAVLRGWRQDAYRTRMPERQRPTLDAITLAGAPEGAEAAWAEAAALVEGVSLTRALVSDPPNLLYPESFVEQCAGLAALGIELTVLDVPAMTALGMGALLGVGQGSARPSRLLAMRWDGRGAGGDPELALVGKGVTFDTGGISLKPGPGMEDMKWDMGGAAAVTGLMHVLAGRKAKVNAIGILGLVENMPDGNAQRPGDVVTSMSGQTIEIINTDAEGRLVLADALWYTQERFKPKFMIDLATMTGAMIVALGLDYAGVFSNSDEVADPILAAAKKVGENFWRMPIPAIYEQHIDSKIADVKNTGNGRAGGSITAALFLQRFTNGVPWAHLDIAPTAWANKSPSPTVPEGGVGFAVRTLDRMVADTYEA